MTRLTVKSGLIPILCFAESFSESDEMLMKAKINFTATVVGNHPNVVKFIGVVVEDHTSKSWVVALKMIKRKTQCHKQVRHPIKSIMQRCKLSERIYLVLK